MHLKNRLVQWQKAIRYSLTPEAVEILLDPFKPVDHIL